jgi:DNA-binding protein HU-beta
MAKAAQAAAAKKPAAPAKGDKAPVPGKAKAPAKAEGGPAAANGATAAAVSLKQMAAGLAESHDLPKKQAEAVLGDLMTLATKHLKNGDKIRLTGLGILQVQNRPARMGRNPGTGEAIEIKASKKIAFRAAKELKEAV